MKAKIRPHNLSEERRRELDAAAREYVEREKEKLMQEIRWAVAKRWTLALALSLNDHYGFGAKKIKVSTDGLEDILVGVAAEVLKDGGQTVREDGSDDDCDFMMRELIDRGIEIFFEGDPAYGDMGMIRARLGMDPEIELITDETEDIGEMVEKNFGISLRKLRTERGLSQRDLGKELGVSGASIGYYENADRAPGLDIAAKIALYFGVSIDELIGLEAKKKKPSGVGASESKRKGDNQ